MTAALEGGEWSAARPGRTLPPEKTRYPLYRRLGGPQGRSGQVRKISSLPGFDPGPSSPYLVAILTGIPGPSTRTWRPEKASLHTAENPDQNGLLHVSRTAVHGHCGYQQQNFTRANRFSTRQVKNTCSGRISCLNHKTQPLQEHPCSCLRYTNTSETLGTPLALTQHVQTLPNFSPDTGRTTYILQSSLVHYL